MAGEQVAASVNSLVGYKLVLDPRNSGLFIEKVNSITLDFFKEGHDSIVVAESMDQKPLLKNIKAGILRVFKKDKDVTVDFGGSGVENDSRRNPIVTDIPKKKTVDDEPFIKVLNRNNEPEILRNILAIADLNVLERLRFLEESGNNPTNLCRRAVIDAILQQIEKTPGVTSAREIKSEKEVITVK